MKSVDKEDYIYEGSHLTISEFNLIMSLFMSRFGLTNQCMNSLLKVIRFILPDSNRTPANLQKMKNEMSVKKSYRSETVCMRCFNIKTNMDSLCTNEDCIYSNSTQMEPSKTSNEIVYFDAHSQLTEIIKRENNCIEKYYHVSYTVKSNKMSFHSLRLIKGM